MPKSEAQHIHERKLARKRWLLSEEIKERARLASVAASKQRVEAEAKEDEVALQPA